MKMKKGNEASITQPLLKDLLDRQKAQATMTFDGVFKKADGGSTPLEPPALYQDSGEGYNANFVFPQD